jgi:hypothetical protein
MAPAPFLAHTLLHEYISPLPLRKPPLQLGLPDSDLPVRVGELRAAFDGPGGELRTEWKRSWLTTKTAVDEAYQREAERPLDYIFALSDQVRLVAHRPPDWERPGVPVEVAGTRPPSGAGSSDATRSPAGGRLQRALTQAVRASGSPANLHGGWVIDLDQWVSDTTALFARLRPFAGHQLVARPEFVPVLTEWIRARGLETGRHRRMIHADVGLPSDLDSFRGHVDLLNTAVTHTADRLGQVFSRGGLGAYRDAARLTLTLERALPLRSGDVAVRVLFVEGEAGQALEIPAIGLSLPAPAGYPLRLADGTIAHLPRPPWQMGWSWDPRGEEGAGHE